jgi:hypothetical protein
MNNEKKNYYKFLCQDQTQQQQQKQQQQRQQTSIR